MTPSKPLNAVSLSLNFLTLFFPLTLIPWLVSISIFLSAHLLVFFKPEPLVGDLSRSLNLILKYWVFNYVTFCLWTVSASGYPQEGNDVNICNWTLLSSMQTLMKPNTGIYSSFIALNWSHVFHKYSTQDINPEAGASLILPIPTWIITLSLKIPTM